jgi:hypothetical protein
VGVIGTLDELPGGRDAEDGDRHLVLGEALACPSRSRSPASVSTAEL